MVASWKINDELMKLSTIDVLILTETFECTWIKIGNSLDEHLTKNEKIRNSVSLFFVFVADYTRSRY